MENILEKISSLVKDCGKIMLNADRDRLNTLEKGGHANFVTDYDKALEKKLKIGLSQIFPQAGFVGEESGKSSYGDYFFIVDPIDGTTNFIRDYKCSCISLALLQADCVEAGVIYNPYLDELYTAQRGGGAYLNGHRIQVSDRDLSEGIIIFGTSPYRRDLDKKAWR